MPEPTSVRVGDVVLYVPACAGDRTECVHEPITGDRAAMVNHVEDGGVLGLTVFHRNGTPTLPGIRYSATRELGTWHFRGPADV